MKELLKKLMNGKDLTEEESAQMIAMLSEIDNLAMAGAILAALEIKGESVSELTGAARFLREHVTPINVGKPCVDVVGTGGDGGVSFNVSTTAAFVAAGAGTTIAKHGNRAVSGKSGAADVLAELGYNLDMLPAAVERSIRDNGIGFLFARALHPVMGKVAPLRKALGVHTIFNLLGPLTNPANAEGIVLGVWDSRLLPLFAETLRNLNMKRALVIHSRDGLDEISSIAPTDYALLEDNAISFGTFTPEELLPSEETTGSIAGGSAAENATILKNILNGTDHSAKRGMVVLNAAATCYVAGLGRTLAECIPMAERSIDSGAALQKLKTMVEASCA
ncbi:MAG: anthranilate phosphoribosyltransferase [Victivallales bacterium]|nr:anthranilate phosphoribosyltransferase [Victivallales bacterium]